MYTWQGPNHGRLIEDFGVYLVELEASLESFKENMSEIELWQQ